MTDKINAFFTAIKQGDTAAVANMLDQSAVLLQAQDTSGLSPVMTAAYYQHPEVVELLEKHGAVLNIFEASAAGNVDRVKALLHLDTTQAHAYAPDGFQPLGLASFFGHRAVAELLIEAGADVNSPSQNGLHVQPLNSAAAGGHLEVARLLLEHGANPNARQAEDFTPLHAAAENGQIEMAQLLLEHGADRSAQANGKTPLELAQAKGHSELAALLAG